MQHKIISSVKVYKVAWTTIKRLKLQLFHNNSSPFWPWPHSSELLDRQPSLKTEVNKLCTTDIVTVYNSFITSNLKRTEVFPTTAKSNKNNQNYLIKILVGSNMAQKSQGCHGGNQSHVTLPDINPNKAGRPKNRLKFKPQTATVQSTPEL